MGGGRVRRERGGRRLAARQRADPAAQGPPPFFQYFNVLPENQTGIAAGAGRPLRTCGRPSALIRYPPLRSRRGVAAGLGGALAPASTAGRIPVAIAGRRCYYLIIIQNLYKLMKKKVRTFSANDQEVAMLEALAAYHGFSKSAMLTSLVKKEFWRVFPSGTDEIRADSNAWVKEKNGHGPQGH
jgi:hypothetical protein